MSTLLADSLRDSVSEQVAPIVRLRGALADQWTIELDAARARARLRAGVVAFDALAVIGSVGNLLVPFVRATVVLEHAGLISNDDAVQGRERHSGLAALLASWLVGEPLPRDRGRAAAARAAALVGGSILSRARALVLEDSPAEPWERGCCPCCAGPAEFALQLRGGRTLVCARCDAAWATASSGCVGCGADAEPTAGHIASPPLDYRLLICNACGRYLKEPDRPVPFDPTVERVLTAELDRAAEARGLRL